MKYKLIDPLLVQLSRALFLIKEVRPVRLSGRSRDWVLLIQGRGFTRLLQDEVLCSGNLHRPSSAGMPRSRRFFSEGHALAAAQAMGLVRRRVAWLIDSEKSPRDRAGK